MIDAYQMIELHAGEGTSSSPSSYSSNDLGERPTLDRHSETLEKLREDLAEQILWPIGDRGVIVQFGEQISLVNHLEAKNARRVLATLTSQFEAAVQLGLDEINATIDTPGGQIIG